MNLIVTASLLSEMDLILRFFKPLRIYQNRSIKLFKTQSGSFDVYFCITGVGEKNIQKFLDYLKNNNLIPSIWISIGYAGAINPSLKPGDLLLMHSVILPEGGIINIRLPDSLLETLQGLKFCSCYYTTKFMDREEKLKLLNEKPEVSSVDMESGPIAMFCNNNIIPLCIIRSISDSVYFRFPSFFPPKRRDNFNKIGFFNPFNWVRYISLKKNMQKANKNLFRIIKRIILYINS